MANTIYDTVYVTPDDFKNNPYGGFDLRAALRNDINDNPSNQAEMFLALVTKHLMIWIDKNTFRNFRWELLTPFQLGLWKDAIIVQANYTYREGAKAFGMSSGADDERGKILDPSYLQQITVCQACLDCLITAGIFNTNIKNRRKTWGYGGNYGFF